MSEKETIDLEHLYEEIEKLLSTFSASGDEEV